MITLLALVHLIAYSTSLGVLSRARAPVMAVVSSHLLTLCLLNQKPLMNFSLGTGTMVGDIGFDPLQISDMVPLAWSREAELKHARVCMLAFAGWVSVDLGFRVPYAPEVRHSISLAVTCTAIALSASASRCTHALVCFVSVSSFCVVN